jgi:hypothetical protein
MGEEFCKHCGAIMIVVDVEPIGDGVRVSKMCIRQAYQGDHGR